MNPIFQLPILIPVVLAAGAIALAGAWRGGIGLTPKRRWLLLALRAAAIAGLCVILFDPGRWVAPPEVRVPAWLVLQDVSSSMNQPAGEGSTRANAAAKLTAQAVSAARDAGVPLRIHPFSEGPSAAVAEPPQVANGSGTRVVRSVAGLLEESAATGDPVAGVIVLSDGRQTGGFTQTDLDTLALRARSLDAAVHTVTLGADATPADLALIQPRAAVTVFAGQPVRIPFVLKSTGLDPVRPTVSLRDATGKELATKQVDLAPGATAGAAFDLTAPAESAQWTLETPALPGEVRVSNNSASVNIRVLTSKTRVFLVEGAPYWDSKFLAQLLRAQTHVELQSVHRLSDQRYFRIDSGTSNSETDQPVFPKSLEELARFDLIVFGKNTDPFLTPENAAMLRAYVRDHGGAVLFSRGKPTTGEVPELEPLEPVVWGAGGMADFRFIPTRDGEAAGLFGQALPAPDASLWTSLPTLRDGRGVSLVKPFARVLAEGSGAGSNAPGGKFPALVVSRYGQGVTGLVNGDGLWKWDFFPEARELGNCYEDFWTQVIQWMASYSEFLPGQDFSLRLPSMRGEAGLTLPASVSYRGSKPVPQPTVRITAPDGAATNVTPAAIADPSGRPAWRLAFTPDRPGRWLLKLIDPRKSAPPTPEVAFVVPAPPTESDDLSADPELMETLARATGGNAVKPEGFTGFLASSLDRSHTATRESGAVWQSSWRAVPVALTLALIFSLEWLLRRRQGLS